MRTLLDKLRVPALITLTVLVWCLKTFIIGFISHFFHIALRSF